MANQRKPALRAKANPALPPSALELAELRIKCSRKAGWFTGNGKSVAEVQAHERKASTLFAAELRRRGWLLPANEGYAAGSWGAK